MTKRKVIEIMGNYIVIPELDEEDELQLEEEREYLWALQEESNREINYLEQE